MKWLIILALEILGISLAFTQQLGYMRDFEKVEKDCYMLSFDSEEDAIRKHSEILDLNGLDTTFTKYDRGNNPVVFSYFKIDPNSDEVVATFILQKDGKFDVWFMEVEDQDTHFIDVVDKNGDLIELIYKKP
jgi:hypothetical protein